MDAKGSETKNSTLNDRPLMISSSSQPTPTQSHPIPRPMPQANNTNPDLVNNLTLPTNPNPNFSMAGEHNHGSKEPEELSSGSTPANPRTRSRGRPRGSKNKVRLYPVTVETESPYALKSLALEFTDGSDILGMLRTYAYENRCGIVVLHSAGNVKNLIIQNRAAHREVITLSGIRQIITINGAIMPNTPSRREANGVSVLVSDENGGALGGIVRGRLVASGPVKIIVGVFKNAAFMRLPTADDETGASSSSSPPVTPPRRRFFQGPLLS